MNEYDIQEQYKILYEEFMEIVREEHEDIDESLQEQLRFRENTVKTAYDIRAVDGKNDK